MCEVIPPLAVWTYLPYLTLFLPSGDSFCSRPRLNIEMSKKTLLLSPELKSKHTDLWMDRYVGTTQD